MKALTTMNNLQLVNKQTLTTTSNIVAKQFNKRHSDLLRAIDNIIPNLSTEFAQRNITFTKEFNELANREVKSYTLTKDGFMMVAMSLTGKEAMQWKEAFINEFNLLQEHNALLKDIAWEAIKGENYLNQSIALKLAGIERIGLFMRYLKANETFLQKTIDNGHIRNMRCGSNKEDTCWKFTQKGFEWLLANKAKANAWVATQHKGA